MRTREFARGYARPSFYSILLVFLTGIISSCDGGPTGPTSELEPVEVTPAVTVSPADADAAVGASLRFQAEVKDQDGNVIEGAKLTWLSDTPEVATVDETGLATALAQGTARIQVKIDGVIGAANFVVREEDAPTRPGTVTDLRLEGPGPASFTAAFTQVDDGTGSPARYRLRYAATDGDPDWPGDYQTVRDGACAFPAAGTAIGAAFTCEVEGLEPDTEYDFRVTAYPAKGNGPRGDASNRARGTTEPSPILGIWIEAASLKALPTSGTAWENLRSVADERCPRFNLSDQDNANNTCIMAKALVHARTGSSVHRDEVVGALRDLARMGRYNGRALALGRNLGAYAIAADLVGLSTFDPALDKAVRAKFRELLTTPTDGAASSLVDCHERRPNNWGTHCGGARAAVAAYLQDEEELSRTARVFRGFVGEGSYDAFEFGGNRSRLDRSWECYEERPVGINPKGCRKDGRNLDGVIPDDQRRGGRFNARRWPPTKELYVWEALQGLLMQAVVLDQAGLPAFEWGDRAILRAVTWLHEVADFRADRANTWQPRIVNHYYGTSFPAPRDPRPGKNVGWTDWTHR